LERKCAKLGIAALGITDYYSVDGYKHVRKAQLEDGRLKGILLIPNIEFRIDTIVYPEATPAGVGAAKRINLHVLFDPTVDPAKIEDDFLHRLTFVREDLAFDSADRNVLNENNLRSFGQDRVNQESRFRDRSPMEVACSIAVVNEDAIKKYLFEDQATFRRRALIVLADDNTSDMAWGGAAHAVRQKLVQMSNAVFSASESSRQFYLGKKHSSVDEYVREFGTVKPCYWGSDAHSLAERFLEPDQQRYLWLKCDPSWEGLRQTLFEPEERVAIGPTPPMGSKSSYAMNAIMIDCSGGSALPVKLKPQTISLNKGLVTIIGGRGSGKTALLDLLASAYATGKREIQDTASSFICRVFPRGGAVGGSIDLTYNFVGRDEFHTSIVNSNDWTVLTETDVTYLQQNHCDSITCDPTSLKNQILKLVFDRFPEEYSTYQDLRAKLDRAEQSIKDTNADISAASHELEPMSQVVEARNLGQGRVADLEKQLKELEALQAPSQLVLQAVQRKDEATTIRSNSESLLLRLSEAQDCAKRVSDELCSFSWETINADLLALSVVAPELTQLPADSVAAATDRVMEQIESNIQSLSSLRLKLNRELTEIGKTTDSLDQHQKDIEHVNSQLQDARNQLAESDKQLGHLHEVEQRIDVLQTKLKASYSSLVEAHANEQECLQRLVTELMELSESDLADLTFSTELSANVDDILGVALSLVNKNLLDASQLERTVKAMCVAAVEWTKDIANTDKRVYLEQSVGQVFQLCEGKYRKGVTRQSFADALLADHFRVQIQIGFKGIPVERLSMGQRAVILLKLVLASGDGSLLLDQPEEDLDNSYLYQELVPAIRRAKKRRQIIIATHNANLVLSADAEEVIIAHYDDGIIQYDVASLENLEKREQITQVLEGGREAFELRERKYGIRF
jgi:ABC-type cobalamin/Fe3+-siderophores transport system ATPase subunit